MINNAVESFPYKKFGQEWFLSTLLKTTVAGAGAEFVGGAPPNMSSKVAEGLRCCYHHHHLLRNKVDFYFYGRHWHHVMMYSRHSPHEGVLGECLIIRVGEVHYLQKDILYDKREISVSDAWHK